MPAWWAIPAIAAGAQLASSFIGSRQGSNTESDNWARMQMQNHDMNFQREMSNTAHQREVEDLKAAGLNPTLSAGGGGASSGSAGGSGITSQPHQIVMPDVLGAISMFQQEKKLAIDKQLADEAVLKSKADRGLTEKRTSLEGKGIIKSLDNQGGELIRGLGDYIKKSLKPNQYYKPPGNNPPNMNPLIKGLD